MYLLIGMAAAWLFATTVVTLVFFGAKRSGMLHTWLFGERASTEVHKLVRLAATPERITRLAA